METHGNKLRGRKRDFWNEFCKESDNHRLISAWCLAPQKWDTLYRFDHSWYGMKNFCWHFLHVPHHRAVKLKISIIITALLIMRIMVLTLLLSVTSPEAKHRYQILWNINMVVSVFNAETSNTVSRSLSVFYSSCVKAQYQFASMFHHWHWYWGFPSFLRWRRSLSALLAATILHESHFWFRCFVERCLAPGIRHLCQHNGVRNSVPSWSSAYSFCYNHAMWTIFNISCQYDEELISAPS